jgi:hypothetical protein
MLWEDVKSVVLKGRTGSSLFPSDSSAEAIYGIYESYSFE